MSKWVQWDISKAKPVRKFRWWAAWIWVGFEILYLLSVIVVAITFGKVDFGGRLLRWGMHLPPAWTNLKMDEAIKEYMGEEKDVCAKQ